jgi:putative addiction module killer protein
MVMQILEYQAEDGSSPFADWFGSLDAPAAAKVATAMARLEAGNTSKVKGVGRGVFEVKIDFGPGYRVYFGKDGPEIVILVGGGTKKRQPRDIAAAQACWDDYKRRKKGGQ